MLCPRCGANVPNGATACGNCGAQFQQGKRCPNCQNVIPENAAVCPKCGARFSQSPASPGLFPQNPKGRIRLWHILLGIGLFIFGYGFGALYSDGVTTTKPNNSSKITSNISSETTSSSQSISSFPSGIVGVEVKKSALDNPLDNFKYEVVGDRVFIKFTLGSYSKGTNVLEITSSYSMDGKKFATVLTDFKLGSSVDVLILDEGISEVSTHFFNSAHVQKIFFPKSLTNIYDYTLSYLHLDEGERVKIYYAGTQEEWEAIFSEYKRTPVGDAEFGEEKGAAIADWLNEKVGTEYDSEKFEYFFSASPEDLRGED